LPASFVGSGIFLKRWLPAGPENERSGKTVGGGLVRTPLQVWQRVDAFSVAHRFIAPNQLI
jgi:hypothetical protein